MEDSVAGAPPSKFRSARDFIHGHDHVGKIAHESLRHLTNRRASDGGRSVVYAQRTVLGEERRNTLRILATPCLCVTLGERFQLGHVSRFIECHWRGKLAASPTDYFT